MDAIESITQLETHYAEAVPGSLTKVCYAITPLYRDWLNQSRFVILSTVGPEGTDASPRGDIDPVVRVQDANTLLLPDWRGNNRIDSLRNIVRDDRVSLMFMVPGCTNVVRVNGTAIVTADTALRDSFEHKGKTPATVIVTTVQEVYFQCAKAIMRSDLWGDQRPKVPTAGEFLRERETGFDAESYDSGYADYAKPRMW